MATTVPQIREGNRGEYLVVLAALAVTLISARPYAGAWNDGSRLATVEALVDHGTLAIDRSIFVAVPHPGDPTGRNPYPPDAAALRRHGTKDKLLIDSRFYSDKSPVPALLLAAVYQILQWLTGLTAQQDPATFCYVLTVASAGAAYVAGVWAVYRLGRVTGLPAPTRVALTACFALSTVALVYVRHVNNHILLLGVAALLMLGLARLAEAARAGRVSWGRLASLGTLAGLGYAIDLGAGPVLFACTAVLVTWRCRSLRAAALFVLAAAPWLALHHAVNYAVGGTFGPANAVPEYFLWEGCPFTPQNMTGAWNHENLGGFVVYALALLFGKHGFIGHNLPLFLAVPALVALLWRRVPELPELLFVGFWCGGTWLAYAITSRNYSGQCCSVRWFVPLLAPAFYALAVYLARCPRCRTDLLLLGGWGAVLTAVAWWYGPWIRHMVPAFWPLQGAALLSWLAWRGRVNRGAEPGQGVAASSPDCSARAA